jgi:hypothetical protein
MKRLMVALAMAGIGGVVSGCQSTQSRQAELQTICANPANRQPQSFYWSECQALYPSTPKQLEEDAFQGAPTGNR